MRLIKRTGVLTQYEYDPWRRLLAAVVLQAVKDAYFPTQCPQWHRVTAREFLANEDIQPVVEWLGLSWARVKDGQIEVTS